MIKDPGALYDPQGLEPEQGPGPKPTPPTKDTVPSQSALDYLGTVMTSPGSLQRAGKSFQFNQDQSDIEKFLPTGVNDPAITGEDNTLLMGRRQTVANKIGRRLANLVPNMTAGLIETAGYTGALLTEWGDNKDYDNAFIKAAATLRDPAGVNYNRQDQSTLGGSLSDPTWWVDNFAQLVEYAAPMAVAGAGAGNFMRAVATKASEALSLGAAGTRAAGAVAQGLSAGYLAYAEAAQSGNQVFKEVYDHQLNKLTSEGKTVEEAQDEAKHIAAQSAATTVQLSTAMSTALNLHAVAPYFKVAENAENRALTSALTREAGESSADWASRFRSTTVPTARSEGFLHTAIEMGLEGTEEVVQNIGQVTGTEMGKEGKTSGILDQFGQISNYLDRASAKDNILSFALGAIGGGLIEQVSQKVLPSQRVQKMDSNGQPIQQVREGELQFDKDGKPIYQTAWVSPRTSDIWNKQARFASQKEALAEDIDNFSKLELEHKVALAAGDTVKADKIKNDLFNTAQLYAVKTGMTEPWKDTYRNIAGLTQEEAIQGGLAIDEKDTAYKKRANDAIADLDTYTHEYDKLMSKYGVQYEANAGVKQVVDMMFARKVDLLSWDKTLKTHEQELEQAEKEASSLASMKDPETYNAWLESQNKKYQSAKIVNARFLSDLKSLETAVNKNDMQTVDRMIKKYRAVGINDSDRAGAVKDLERKITAHSNRLAEDLRITQDSMFNSTDYANWLENNPNKKFGDYIEEVQKRYAADATNDLHRANIETSRGEYNIASKNYADIADERSVSKFINKANNWMAELQAQTIETQKQQTLELANRAKDKASLNKLERISLNQIAERYKAERDNNLRVVKEWQDRLDAINKEDQAVSMFKDPIRKLGLKGQIKEAKNAIALANAKANKLNSLYEEHAVDTSTQNTDIDIDTLTQENSEDEDGLPDQIDTELPQDSEVVDESLVQSIVPSEEITLPIDNEESATPDEVDLLMRQIMEIGLSPEEIENNNATYEVVKELNRMTYSLPEKVINKLDSIEQGLRDGTIGFSYDLLKDQVAEGLLTQGEAAQVLQLLNDSIQLSIEDAAIRDSLNNEDEIAQEESVANPPGVDISDIGTPDSPAIDNADETVATNLPGEDTGNQARHAGYKIANVMSVANSTLNYTETFDEKTQTYRKLNLPSEINPNVNPDVLRGNKLSAGTAVHYELDTEYNGEANINDELILDEFGNKVLTTEKFADYIDTNGNVLHTASKIGNVPIKIVDIATGKTIGYMRKLDWVNAKYPGTSDYRNVQHITYDEQGNPVDNIAVQSSNLLAARMAIVEQYNNGRRNTEGNIISKGGGLPILNYKTNRNTESSKVELGFARAKNPENSLLPDQSLTIAIVDNGTAYSGRSFAFNKEKAYDNVELNNGNIVVMLPTANGKFTYAPLIGQRLAEGKRKTAVQTVAKVIELYLQNDGTNQEVINEIKELEANTGFNIANEKGLKDFINQWFTYTQSFQQTHTAAGTITEGPRTEQFLFNVWDKTGTQNWGNIRAGWSYSGKPIVNATLINGKLNPAFIATLEEGFQTRSRAVVYTDVARNLKGINSTGTFKDVIYTNDGKWKYTEYPSYNEYVKSFSKTAVYGKNKVGNSYVYVANPQIEIDVRPVEEFPTLSIEENNTTTTVPTISTESVPAFDESATDFFDDLPVFSLNRTVTPIVQVNELATAPEDSKQMDIRNLEELYNFTPESQRNGKTVQEVFRQLAGAGHTFLAKGFNPFSRCL